MVISNGLSLKLRFANNHLYNSIIAMTGNSSHMNKYKSIYLYNAIPKNISSNALEQLSGTYLKHYM